ncbi:hypothetical protein [Maritimibacter sp. UBA3975]|uniref:Flp family type IVb pilin n=1 Tax=Maritimibacter sp. UBA3975 TaxID=1946833 RepID=UPI000C0B92D0|nr:hypothetical protein [Maritimibacter sp. UBA3975]MAM62279.1 Flp family type IVb pilin [Maritimibacter sp.]|tara:strand:- start:3071 stop:3268 length:198 start_codon:yes stop_codon:yes gene_type:complete
MFNIIKSTLGRFRKDESGATLVEYGIALSLAITIGAGAFLTLSGDVSESMGAASSALPDAPAAPS